VVPFQIPIITLLAGGLGLAPSHKPNPEILYLVSIDSVNSAINVTMQIGNAPRSMRLAMAIHPEYNDRFWRYVHDLHVDKGSQPATLVADGDNAWRLITRSGSASVSYRIQLPPENPTNRGSWHTAIRGDGGSINTIDTFLYLPDYPDAQVDISMNVHSPSVSALTGGRAILSGGRLVVPGEKPQPPAKPITMLRTDSRTLLDSPILYGDSLRIWRFDIDGVAHTIAYWPLPNATPFDTAQFVDAIQKVAREAVAVFGELPYPRYEFLLEDGAWGALEHKNSVTIGMPSKDLAADPRAYLVELAHEFFHSWNLMRLYPEGRGVLSAEPPAHSTGLWLSEGVTMFYSEALTRRAGLPEQNMSRSDLLAEQLESYYGNPGNTRISPEVASSRAVDTTGNNGDYEPNYYVQGRLIGMALDLIIRDSTKGQRGLDDLMRALYSRFAMKRGFTTDDVERTASNVCGCNMRRFFDDHVRNAHPLDFNRYLPSIGLRAIVDTIPAVDSAGSPLPDTRIWAYPPRSGGRMRVWIQDPGSVWARSGLHTGQELIAFNTTPIDSFPSFRRAFRTVRLGQDVPLDILRDGSPARIIVRVSGYNRPRVRIVDDPNPSPAALERRRVWLAGR
jgi:predicted metalloprotease with PDZ domain